MGTSIEDSTKKKVRLQSKGQQDKELSKGAESKRERGKKRPGTGVRLRGK
jgi:hypothetical protein